MVFERLGAYDCSISFAVRALSTCLCVKLHLSASRSRELKHHPFRASGHTQNTKAPKCKPNCAPGGTLSKTRLASCSGATLAGSGGILGGIHWRATLAGYSAGSTGEPKGKTQRDTRRDPLAGCSGGILGGIHWRATLAGYSAGSTGELLWRDPRRDPMASCSGGILGGGVV